MEKYILDDLQREIWEAKYKAPTDKCIEDTWERVARWVASAEQTEQYRKSYFQRFYDMLYDFKFIPGGRITESAGTSNSYASNCYVLDIEDSLEHIFETIKRVAIISKKNGGCGFSFDKIRPKDAPLSGGGTGSGVVSFMKIFDTSCEVIKTGSKNRRAALIGILGVSHPEIFDFIDAKSKNGILSNFNISVSITDNFIKAVKDDADWDLVHNGKIYRTVKAKEIWDKLCYSGWMYNDPGIFFKDNTNRYNNLYYIQELEACNPCGELALFPWQACCLGSVNMTKFVVDPFTDAARFNLEEYLNVVRIGVHFLDNVVSVTEYPYPENKDIAERDRRIGLNPYAGLGDALAMRGYKYDSKDARDFVSNLAVIVKNEVYEYSSKLAALKLSFKSYSSKYLDANFIKTLDFSVQEQIRNNGIRNCSILTCPPVGTGSMLAGNISSGIEPIFSLEFNRSILNPDGTKRTKLLEDYAWKIWKEKNKDYTDKPAIFQTAMEIDPFDHILMQSTIQKHLDSSISKTANIPNEYTVEDYSKLLMFAWENKLNGFTTFRDGTRESVLSLADTSKKHESNTCVDISIDRNKRPRKLSGDTFRIPEANGENTYCTINHNNGKPWEIFFNASGQNHEWFAAIGRLASRIMRKTGDVQSVIDELKHIKGEGFIVQGHGYVSSRPALVGLMLEEFNNTLNKADDSVSSSIIGQCDECNGNLVKRGGCIQCENGCPESSKCG